MEKIKLLLGKYIAEQRIVHANMNILLQSNHSIPDHADWMADLEVLVQESERLQSLIDHCTALSTLPKEGNTNDKV